MRLFFGTLALAVIPVSCFLPHARVKIGISAGVGSACVGLRVASLSDDGSPPDLGGGKDDKIDLKGLVNAVGDGGADGRANVAQSPIRMLDEEFQRRSFLLSKDDIGAHFKMADKVVNAFGLFSFLVTLLTAVPYWLALTVVKKWTDRLPADERGNYRRYDNVGKVWSKAWLALTNSYPHIVGTDKLKAVQGPCLIVANHASWLDIPVLCTVLDGEFKFIAKGELVKVPLIGKQLTGGHHVLIERTDRRSQLRTFKTGISYLEQGVPIMAFPEGQRSKSGRLEEFKGGMFSMSIRSKVPVLPITICNSHSVMPSNSLFPVQPGKGKLKIVIHDLVQFDEGRSEAELSALVRDVISTALPLDQQPLSKVAATSV